MATTTKQVKSARSSVHKAKPAARSQRATPRQSSSMKSAIPRQGTAMASRKRSASASFKTRAELYELAQKRDLPGRSRMDRSELARKLGVR